MQETPKLNQIKVIMTEEEEKDAELLLNRIVTEMKEKKVSLETQREFLNEYFSVRDGGHDKLMKLYHSWVRLQKETVR